MKSTLPILVGISVCSLGALYYFYLKDKKKKSSLTPEAMSPVLIKTKDEPLETVEFVVSKQQVPMIIGRNTTMLKHIEEKTSTKILFREKDGDNQICSIKGYKANIVAAKKLVEFEASRPPILTDEILVPQSKCGKIVGKCGEALQEISRLSSAKVWVDPASRKLLDDNRRVLITGTKEQLAMAKKLIEEKIQEDVTDSEEKSSTLKARDEEFKREPRSPSNHDSTSSLTTTETPREILPPTAEKLRSSSTDGQLEVFVSAISSPSRFWVQIVGSSATELDILVQEMTVYYNIVENQALHQIREPYLGKIVAAKFNYDNKWYRAEIVAIQPNEFKSQEIVLDLYFVDYGDTQFVKPENVFELRTDFLSLRFQAIECFLAHVQPTTNKLDQWDEEAVDKFEALTHVAQWKKLISKVVTYKDRTSFASHSRSQREGSPIPGVELFDVDISEKSINLELVNLGLAELSSRFGDIQKSSILTLVEPEVEEVAEVVVPEKEKTPEITPVVPISVPEPTPFELPPKANGDSKPSTSPKSNKSKNVSANALNGDGVNFQTPMKSTNKVNDFLKNEIYQSEDWNKLLEE